MYHSFNPNCLAENAQKVVGVLNALLPQYQIERRLSHAMRYGVFSGGKMLRPFLVTSAANIFLADQTQALRVAAAVECAHVSSLIHDDLPGVDNDDMRHHKPTVHKEFDEATAIFAGNCLNSTAFEILSDQDTHNDSLVRLKLTKLFAETITSLQRGQQMDIAPERQSFDIEQLRNLQQLKTGALIACAVQAGALLGRAPDSEINALRNYSYYFGQAYQIVNDLLDAEGEQALIGKNVRKDREANKATFVTLFGSKGAFSQAEFLLDEACRCLTPFGGRAEKLIGVAHFMIKTPLDAITHSASYVAPSSLIRTIPGI